MNENDKKELAMIDGFIADYQKERAKLLAREGLSGAVGGTAGVIAREQHVEEERATLYDRMTPSELMRLYETDKVAWQEVMDAKQAHGMRKLIRWR